MTTSSHEEQPAQQVADAPAVPQPRTEPRTSPDYDHPAMQELLVIHGVIRRGMQLLSDAAAAAQPGEKRRITTLAKATQTQAAFIHHHHHGEDAYFWPAFLETSPEVATALEPLMRDHTELTPMLDDMQRLSKRLLADPADGQALADLEQVLANARRHLDEHLAAEEPMSAPLLAALSPEKHRQLSQTMGKEAPKKGLSYFLGMLEETNPVKQQLVLEVLPAPIVKLRPLFLRTYRRNVQRLNTAR